jgi:hypothetical protein
VKQLVVALRAPGDRKTALRLRFRPVLSDVEGMTNTIINLTNHLEPIRKLLCHSTNSPLNLEHPFVGHFIFR